ncbi:MAG: PQQ-dependent sugar dehydrogenase [Bacteroidia bacterium]|nr:PQQ-dependent sugar dehydrogenase [Bacteroidia bacterium]NND26402.1 PQQ-dependent sugar dehydrogenase [Flavobacteriaceae bacterium]MBT8278200.1 PQQ-dependent sugar dehydrogenase [Bacteroidia bacterium]NNK58996.1 PQQ-dependent sugar dehydrogenase [Flavobacteriaceae bacterium]NNL32121.1 PQQ-dependent sugar dehydrogenase [Flavobacteriaceae bacterium]
MRPNKYCAIFFIFILNLSCNENKTSTAAITVSSTNSYTHEIVVDKLNIPWGFVFLPDESMLITEKQGNLIHFKNGQRTLIEGLPEIEVLGQGGLLDIELHPDYKTNGWIYISYASPEGDGPGANTAIMRFKLDGKQMTDKKVLYKATPNSRRGQHFGSRLEFDNDGFLYFTIGDRGNRDINPQNIERDGGKVYRIHDDGRIPTDNPFVRDRNAKKAIFCYGNRNIQGMAKHPETGAIWTHEHGPRGGDEINIVEAGKNYGWPKISYGINYSGTTFTENTALPGMEQPLHYWDPSIAPSGMAFVTSNIYPEWKGNLMVGVLKFQYLNRCVIKNNKVVSEEKLIEGLGRVRSVKQGPDGYIYVGVENVGIVKIIPKK